MVFALLGCTPTPQAQPRALQPFESFAQNQWSGFTVSDSQRVSVGWCVSGDFKGQAAAQWIIPYQQGYLIKRQYLDTTTCELPTFDLPLGD